SAAHHRAGGCAARDTGLRRTLGNAADRSAPRSHTPAGATCGLGGRVGFHAGAPRQGGPESQSSMRNEAHLGWALTLPALSAIALVGVFPIIGTMGGSLYVHDLRMPWLGRPFVGLANYAEAVSSARFWRAMAHTAVFTAATVTLELAGGLLLALIVNHISR